MFLEILEEGAERIQVFLVKKFGKKAEKPVRKRGHVGVRDRGRREADEVGVEAKAKREVEGRIGFVHCRHRQQHLLQSC
jgi:hypothetical protein